MPEENPQKKELEMTVPIPIVQLMNDLSQGYSLEYPLEGKVVKKYKVFKKLGNIHFEVVLLDHDLMTGPQDPGASLFVYRETKEHDLDNFSIIGRKRGSQGFYVFSTEEVHLSKIPMSQFWDEYTKAEIDINEKNKAIGQDNELRDAVVELNPQSPRLALLSGK